MAAIAGGEGTRNQLFDGSSNCQNFRGADETYFSEFQYSYMIDFFRALKEKKVLWGRAKLGLNLYNGEPQKVEKIDKRDIYGWKGEPKESVNAKVEWVLVQGCHLTEKVVYYSLLTRVIDDDSCSKSCSKESEFLNLRRVDSRVYRIPFEIFQRQVLGFFDQTMPKAMIYAEEVSKFVAQLNGFKYGELKKQDREEIKSIGKEINAIGNLRMMMKVLGCIDRWRSVVENLWEGIGSSD